MADSFNDLSRPIAAADSTSQALPFSSANGATPQASVQNGDSSYVPRPKRIACVVCRRRKLRCDGKKPSCGTCSRLGHECAYDEVRKKSGPKRGYVKQLEARLAQVETLLKTQEPNAPQSQENAFNTMPMPDNSLSGISGIPDIPEMLELPGLQPDMDSSISPPGTTGQHQSDNSYLPEGGFGAADHLRWDMISLGLEEPLPTQDVIDELNQIYLEKIHPSTPIIHMPRYLASMNLSFNVRPPVYLQYIVWCHAAVVSDKYSNLHEHFYHRARKYAEISEMKGLGEGIVSLAYCQTWLLVGLYEFRMMSFPRAWLSVGKSARLVLMMGLNRIDGLGLEVKQSLPPARDCIEREERRRVFWMAFCSDRYASIGTGWPMTLDERDIMTNLPATEESFIKGSPEQTLRLDDFLSGNGTSNLSPFGSVALMATLLGRNLTHLHRPDPQDNDNDLNGEFWKRHRSYDNILLNFALSLPNHLRLPTGISDPNVVFCNMSLHTSTICLHQAAIFKAEKNKMPNQIVTESKRRCIVAADQISSIMKIISHFDLGTMNPFMSFCVYVAARVFVQYLKSRPNDSTVQSSLQFVLAALKALTNKNPLTESFLHQLEVDIEGSAGSSQVTTQCPNSNKISCIPNEGSFECAPMLHIREESTQHDGTSSDQSSNSGRHGVSNSRSLPSRTKQTPFHNPNTGLNRGARNFNLGTETAGTTTIIDMDFSPDLSDKNNPPSDHPTPSTINSSSNTSYSRVDHPTPPKSQQQSAPNSGTQGPMGSINSVDFASISATATDNANFNSAQYFASNTEAPLNSTGLPSTWEFTATQTSTTETDNLGMPSGMTPGMMDSLNEAQWAQLLNSTNWDAWRS